MAKNTDIVLSSTTDDVAIKTKLGAIEDETKISIVDMFEAMSRISYQTTGLLPVSGTGLLCMRQALDHKQIVFQYEPGVYPISWVDGEGDDPETYHLAQPYRIVIMDLKGGNLLGGKQFYSPVRIDDWDQPLYHTNVPNTNCRGYGMNNAVGWTCIYHTDDITQMAPREQLDYVLKRISGEETYNDGNMSETDGTRFYQDHGKPDYLCNPDRWQEKTKKEGWEWTLDSKLWIPILVESPDCQNQHVDGGMPLTLKMAMMGHYSAYYDDVKPNVSNSNGYYAFGEGKAGNSVEKYYNIMDREDGDLETLSKQIFQQLRQAATNQKSRPKFTLSQEDSSVKFLTEDLEVKEVFKDHCRYCESTFSTHDSVEVAEAERKWWLDGEAPTNNKHTLATKTGGLACDTCVTNMFDCALCEQSWLGMKHGMPYFNKDHVLKESSGKQKICHQCFVYITSQLVKCKSCEAQWVSPFANNSNSALGKTKQKALDNWFAKSKVKPENALSEEGLFEWNAEDVCQHCCKLVNCEFCQGPTNTPYVIDPKKLELKEYTKENITLCANCFGTHVKCACAKLVHVDLLALQGPEGNACGPCVNADPSGNLVYDPDGKYSEVPLDMGSFVLPEPDPDLELDLEMVLEIP